MEIQDIIISNKLIAEFMGATAYKHGIFEAVNFPEATKEGFKSYDLIYLQYHSSWDWIMTVVEKIESLSYNKGRHYYIHITQSHVQFLIDRTNETPFSKWGSTNNKLQAIYKAVIQFIKWYNERKQ